MARSPCEPTAHVATCSNYDPSPMHALKAVSFASNPSRSALPPPFSTLRLRTVLVYPGADQQIAQLVVGHNQLMSCRCAARVSGFGVAG
jgi:hypothetical protein